LLAAQRPEARPISRNDNAVLLGSGKAKADLRSPLFQRLLMLLHCPHRIESRAPKLWSWGLRIAVMSLSIFAACVCIRWPDAEAIEARPSSATAAKHQPFRVADFVADPTHGSPAQRTLPYVMPVVLPDRYDLEVEVFATRFDLARARLAGHPLGLARWQSDAKTSLESDLNDRETWHQVRLVRQGHDLHLWVDGVGLPVTMKPDLTTEALTIEPGPGRSVRFRNLVVEW